MLRILRTAPIYLQCIIGAKSLQSCPTLQPHGLYVARRALCPWDSSGKNTGVDGCALLLPDLGTEPAVSHFLHWQTDSSPLERPGKPNESESVSRSVVSHSSQPHGLQPTDFLGPWYSPGKNTGVGGHSLLQGNLPHPGVKPGSPA